MTHLAITIRDESGHDEETYAGLEERGIKTTPLELQEVIIIEKATSEKRTGLCFLLKDETGKYYSATLTADMIEYGLMGPLKGANSRWGVPAKP